MWKQETAGHAVAIRTKRPPHSRHGRVRPLESVPPKTKFTKRWNPSDKLRDEPFKVIVTDIKSLYKSLERYVSRSYSLASRTNLRHIYVRNLNSESDKPASTSMRAP